MWSTERTVPGVDAQRDELLPYVGPAAALPLFGALARLPFAVAVRAWTVLLVASFAALVLASLALAGRRHAPARGGAPAFLAAALLAAASGPVTSAVALGQVAMLAAAGIACALVAYERSARAAERSIAAGAVATLIAGLQPNLALVLIARLRDRAALLSAALGAIAFGALTLAAGGGVHGFLAYVERLREHASAERFITIQHTPAAIAWAFGAPDAVASAVGTAFAAAAIAVTLAVTVRARLGARDGALLALAAAPLAIPFFHEHDFVIVLVPLLVLALRAHGTARAWAGAATVLVGVDWLGIAQRPAAAAEILATAIAIACAFVVLGAGARAQRADFAPFIALAVVACAAVPLALAFPVPVWPDALPAGYRAPASADASAVWAGEQRAAGLAVRQPAWGALRALPLAGCVVLGVALVRTRRRTSGESA